MDLLQVLHKDPFYMGSQLPPPPPTVTSALLPHAVAPSTTNTQVSYKEMLQSEPPKQTQKRQLCQKNNEYMLHIPAAESRALAASCGYLLIGRFSTIRPEARDIEKLLENMQLQGKCTVKGYDPKHVLIEVSTNEDALTLRQKRRWYVKGKGMKVYRWSPSFTPHEEPPLALVWMCLPHFPMHLRKEDILFDLANMAGEPLKLDRATSEGYRPSAARILVELDVTKKTETRYG